MAAINYVTDPSLQITTGWGAVAEEDLNEYFTRPNQRILNPSIYEYLWLSITTAREVSDLPDRTISTPGHNWHCWGWMAIKYEFV